MAGGCVLGVDPGTAKVGYAVLDPAGLVLVRGIVPPRELSELLARLAAAQAIDVVALGSGTNARQVRAILEGMGLPLCSIDERETTLRARALYFAEHPPHGWRRLIPIGLQLPPVPIDDYAAVLIARRYLLRRECRNMTS
ncbi:MAG: RuvC family protein [Vulcanimicrobiaceae bacterium]